MDWRLALSRRRDALAAVPVAAGLLPGSYMATVEARSIAVRLLAGLVYGYAVVLTLWAVGRFTSEGDTVERSVDRLAANPEQAGRPVFGGMTPSSNVGSPRSRASWGPSSPS